MATLKISELSVGDWVHHDFYEVDMRVRTIYGDTERIIAESNGGYGVTCHIDHFSPIPITPEILEANGFERSTSQFIVYPTDKVWISYDKPSETWSVTMYINNVTSNLHANIKYIHQFQHALRLVGVDKEIVMPNK